MKFFRIFARSFRDSLKSIGRNFSLSIASITCVMITLIIVGAALLLTYNIDNATNSLKNDLSIVVFVSNEADQFDITTIDTKIKGISNVDTKNVTLKTKAEIKQEMMESNDTFKNIMEDWDDDENPLQNVYIVKVINADKIENTAKEIEKIEKVAQVKYGEGTVGTLLLAFNSIKKGSYIAVVALIVVTVFLIINTIKLTIFSRKREISIMRLVGASNSSIKMPFVFEGMFLGIIGSIVPIILMVYTYNWIYENFNGKLLLADIFKIIEPSKILFNSCLIILAIGTVVGMFGSSMAVRKYLKV
jgi:cell division transport system permease protein